MLREHIRSKDDGCSRSNSFMPEVKDRKLAIIRFLIKEESVNTCIQQYQNPTKKTVKKRMKDKVEEISQNTEEKDKEIENGGEM